MNFAILMQGGKSDDPPDQLSKQSLRFTSATCQTVLNAMLFSTERKMSTDFLDYSFILFSMIKGLSISPQ